MKDKKESIEMEKEEAVVEETLCQAGPIDEEV